MSANQSSKALSKFSSKIKDLYIALPGYEYFHSPSSLSKSDKRFIGREHLIHKLENILRNSSTKAGAYLITGYRGVGKSSLVREILSRIREDILPESLRERYSVYDSNQSDKQKRDRLSEKALLWGRMMAMLVFTVGFLTVIWYQWHGPFFSSIEQNISQWLSQVRFGKLHYTVIVLVLVVSIILTLRLYLDAEVNIRNFCKELRRSFYRFVIDRKTVVIELSLAQSELNDLDILKLLSKNFYTQFKAELNPFSSISNLFHFLLRWGFTVVGFLTSYHFFTNLDRLLLKEVYLSNLTVSLVSALLISALVHRFYFSIGSYLGISSPNTILSRLKELNEQIKSNVTTESGTSAGASVLKQSIGITSKRTKAYPQATARTIEAELIDILRQIDMVKPFFRKLNFIFVFDELDKIEVQTGEVEGSTFEEKNNFGPEYSRKRQESIALLLGNMKHFLNVARAKFVFVASREMYDVFLADISDRDGYIGSVFHEVVNVPSFYSESYTESSTDIVRLTEEYVCQFLIPYNLLRPGSSRINNKTRKAGDPVKYDKSLEGYLKYLRETFYAHPDNQLGDWERNAQILKIAFTLRQFIVYLAYRSNGAPKSITRLFESFLRHPGLKGNDSKELNNAHAVVACEDLVKKKQFIRFYLHFDALQQYKFGFTNYIFTQFLVAKSKYMRDFGDKLLVSAAYLVDHLYKFHNMAFSWHHLEQTPEMIDINKSPALRSFMENMVKSLANIHVREIVSGLYQFKFYKRIANEIDYISKVSEMESAAFNFTLDEHLQIKRYYQVKLKDYQSSLPDAFTGKSSGKSLYSLAELYMTLGDLHFHDQEFEEAKRHFTDAIRILKGQEPVERNNVHQFLLMVRNQLKLGLAHEKTQNFSAATAEYGNVSLDVAKWRDLEFKHLGLVKAILHVKEVDKFIDRFRENIESAILQEEDANNNTDSSFTSFLELIKQREKNDGLWEKFRQLLQSNKSKLDLSGTEFSSSMFSSGLLTGIKYRFDQSHSFFRCYLYLAGVFGRRKTMVFYGWPKYMKEEGKGRYNENYYRLSGIENFHSFSRFFMQTMESLSASSEKEKVYLKKTVFEGFRLVYQPLVAKLHAIEKGSMGGVTYSDLRRNLKEFEYLSRAAWHDEKHLLEAEYHNKVGNLLFYKNGYAFGQYNRKMQRLKYREILDQNELGEGYKNTYFKAPIAAYEYYRNSLEILRQRVIEYRTGKLKLYRDSWVKAGERSLFKSFVDFLIGENINYPTINNVLLESIGNNFSDLGNTILSSIPYDLRQEVNSPSLKNTIDVGFVELILGYYPKESKRCELEGFKDEESGLKGLSNVLTVIEDLELSREQPRTPFAVTPFQYFTISRLDTALLCYFLSSKFFLRANRHRKYAFQSMKILYIIKDFLAMRKSVSSDPGTEFKFMAEKLQVGLVRKVLKSIHRTNDNTVRLEREYYKRLFIQSGITETELSNEQLASVLNNVSNAPEVKEVVLIHSEIKLMLEGVNHSLPNTFICNAYSNIPSQYSRVMELRYKHHLNKYHFRKLLEESTMDNQTSTSSLFWNNSSILSSSTKTYFQTAESITISEAAAYLIKDSVFCLSEMLNIFHTYGVSYLTTHSRIAFAHMSLAKWCEYLHVHADRLNKEQGVEFWKEMDRLLESNSVVAVSPEYHYERAIKHFYSALQVHNEGDGYKGKIYNMYYLEDDFNDNLYHFGAAIERYKINTGVITQKLDYCEDQLKHLNKKRKPMAVYDYDAYVV